MVMSEISTETFRFMADLWNNNNKQWFDRNRKRYEQTVREPLKELAESLAGPVSTILPEFNGKPKISRINNDIRFSPKKPLYKEHMWISFSAGGDCSEADIFAAVDRNGWCTGCGIGSNKREPLDGWRKNLLEYTDLWLEYTDSISFGKKSRAYFENIYKKPLFPDIPEEIYDLVQAKGVWIVDDPINEFTVSPEADFFAGMCKNLPIYLFMSQPAGLLESRLSELGRIITPPNREVERIWKIFI